MTDFGALLAALWDCKVEYIVVGGAAAIAHGSARLTQDLDIVYRRTPGNPGRLHSPLTNLTYEALPPVCRSFRDREVLRRGLNFTLITSFGDIDLLGEIPGGGTWEDFGTSCLCLSLPQLIRAKVAAGRPKDIEALAELETIQDERGE